MKQYLKKELKLTDNETEVLFRYLEPKLKGIDNLETLKISAEILLMQLKFDGIIN